MTPFRVSAQFRALRAERRSVNNTTLGTFDSTSLPNGSYTIRLFATNQFGSLPPAAPPSRFPHMKVGVLQSRSTTSPSRSGTMQVIRS